MTKQIITRRESDGKFALRLDSTEAPARYNDKASRDAKRTEQVVAENAAWGAQLGYSADELAMLFA